MTETNQPDGTGPLHREGAVAKQEEAVRRWHDAWYCYRDKVVFVPGQSGVAVPEEIESLLYPPPP